MSTLFKKAAAFCDLHLGLKGNSPVHNKDCEDFIYWFIETAKKENCDTCFFLGDWHHSRNSINLVTLTKSIELLELLGKEFDQFFWFPGNHDLYFKDRREIHSSVFGKHIPGVTVVDHIQTIGNVSIVPWLVADEWKKIANLKGKYIFGHFELPAFYMNSLVMMPDHGQLQRQHLSRADYVFSGHFHKRQQHGNIVYIGNAFPHNYADVNDDARGMMMLEWGRNPEYRTWPDQPVYRNYLLSELVATDDASAFLKPKMHTRVVIDTPISFEEANYLRELFIPTYQLREMILINERIDIEVESIPIDVKIESLDTIVMNQITAIDSDTYDKNILLEIYKDL